MNPAEHHQVRQFRLARRAPTPQYDAPRTRTVAGRSRGGRNRGPGRPPPGVARPGMVRVTRPTSSGWPLPFITIGTTAASQHSMRSDSGATGPPKSRHAGAGPVLQVLQPDQHVQVRAVPTARRAAPTTGRGRARSRTRRPAPRPAAPRRCGRRRAVSGVAWASITAAIASNIAASSNRPFTFPPPSGSRVRNSSFTRAGGRSSGSLAVLIQQLDQRRAPVRAARAGCTGRPCRPAAPPHRPRLRGEPPGRPAAQHPGDHLDVPQPGPARREHLRGRGQPRRQHAAVEPGPRCDLLGGGHPAAGLEPLPAEQVAQRRGRRLVAVLGEHSTPVQRGHRIHRDPVQPPHHRLTRASATPPTRHRCSTRPPSSSASAACTSRRCAAADGLSVTHPFSRAPPTKPGPPARASAKILSTISGGADPYSRESVHNSTNEQ